MKYKQHTHTPYHTISQYYKGICERPMLHSGKSKINGWISRLVGITKAKPRWEDEINNLNRSITTNKIKAVTRYPPTKKFPGPGGFCEEFYQTFKE